MARSFTNSKLLSAFVVDTVSSIVTRRGYAAASSGAAGVRGGSTGVGRSNVMMKKGAGEESSKTTSWVPDPVTGYYRPESHAKEIDAAELRKLLLKHKPRQP